LRAPAPNTPPIETLPDWLPAAVQSHVLLVEKLLAGMPGDLAILYRLTSDDRMKYVWRELQRRAKSDKALVEFFECAWQQARSIARPIETPKDRAARSAPYKQAAKLCRAMVPECDEKGMMLKGDTRALMNPELATAYDLVATRFDEIARREGNLDSPLIVKQHSHDDVARAYVRTLGHVVRKLFRSPLYGTVARIASVALDRKIHLQQVRDWMKS
jgi:hypothetical protein